MAGTAKSAHEQERHNLFVEIRHYVSTRCEPPQHLTYETMLEIMQLLHGFPFKKGKHELP